MPPQSTPRRPYGFWTLVALVIANMIGAGVFTTSGFTIHFLGSPTWVMVAWTIAGFIALCGAYSYGQLIHLMPESGGEYLFLSRTLGPLWGFLAAWVSLIAGFTGAIAFAASALEKYAMPEAVRPSWLPHDLLACGLIVAAGFAHGFHVRFGAQIQNLIVAIKLTLIGSFLVLAATQWNAPVWQGSSTALDFSGNPGFYLAVATSIIWISLSYSGFNAAVYVAEESTEARRIVPRALLTGTLIVFAVYLALNFVFVYAPSRDEIDEQAEVAAIAAQSLGGDLYSGLVRGAVILALVSSVTSMVMAAPRVYAKMAADGRFPRWLQTTSEVPRNAMIVQVILSTGMVLASDLLELLKYLSVTLAISAALTVSCLFFLRSQLGRDRKLALAPAAIYVGATLGLAGLMAVQEPRQLLGTALTLLTGWAAFWLFQATSRR